MPDNQIQLANVDRTIDVGVPINVRVRAEELGESLVEELTDLPPGEPVAAGVPVEPVDLDERIEFWHMGYQGTDSLNDFVGMTEAELAEYLGSDVV